MEDFNDSELMNEIFYADPTTVNTALQSPHRIHVLYLGIKTSFEAVTRYRHTCGQLALRFLLEA